MSFFPKTDFVVRFLAACSFITAVTASAQDPGAGAPVIRDDERKTPAAPSVVAGTDLPLRLDLSRRDLKNFLTDKEALAPHLATDGTPHELRDVFTLGSVNAPYAVFWDPLSCRLIGILDLEAPPESAPTPQAPDKSSPDENGEDTEREPASDPAPSPYLLKATGPMPLTGTPGLSSAARFFGFRLVEGRPEFLYTCGTLAVEERLWLEEGGRILRQRFAAKDATKGLKISVPAEWEGRVNASVGTWKGTVLTVPKESVSEVILTYALAPDPF